ncbi:MAG: glycosyltransferase [Phycisphaerales bacterium]|nr:MAG: glycosyltransferase [Phycisphaerales bacterium]
MKVLLILERACAHGTGGVISAFKLHCALREAGIDSTIACRLRETDREDCVELPRSDFAELWLGRLGWRLGLNDIHCLSTFRITKLPAFREADLVNLHSGHSNYLNYLALPRIARAKPLVVSLHDMWNFTGHCAYCLDCDRWKTGCGKCQYLDTYPPVARDATRIEWKLKNWAYRRSDMVVTAPSRWLCDVASQSMLGRFPIHFVPNFVDVETHAPQDQAACREQLGLEKDRFVIMFVAAALDDPRKGGDLLLEAIRMLPDYIRRDTTLLLLGDRSEQMADRADVPCKCLGYVVDDKAKAACYNAADVFAIPSRDEVQGRVILEALACARPCVGFDVGGIGESVVHGKTGYLAPAEGAEAFSAALQRLYDDPEKREALGRAGRAHVLGENTMKQHLDAFLEAFNTAVERKKAA